MSIRTVVALQFLLAVCRGAAIAVWAMLAIHLLAPTAHPQVNAGGSITSPAGGGPAGPCPTCAIGPNADEPAGIIGGIFGFSSTQFRTPWAQNSTANFFQDNPFSIGGYVRNNSVFLGAAAGTGTRALVVPFLGGDGIAGGFATHNQVGSGFSIINGDPIGAYSDPLTSTFVRVEQFNFYNLATDGFYANQPTLRGWMAEFQTDNNSIIVGSPTIFTANAAAQVVVRPLFNQSDIFDISTPFRALAPIRTAGTAQRLIVVTNAVQPGTGTCVIRMQVNQVDSALTLTVPASGGQGVYTDFVNTVALVAGDLINLAQTNNAASAACAIRSFMIEIVPTTTGEFYIGGYGHPNMDGTTRFSAFFGRSAGAATENNVTSPLPRAGTISNCAVVSSVAGAGGSTVTITLRHNLADSAITVSYATGGALGIQTMAGSVVAAKGDTISMAASTTGGLPGYGNFGCQFQ